jgi:hypothetical protein
MRSGEAAKARCGHGGSVERSAIAVDGAASALEIGDEVKQALAASVVMRLISRNAAT